MSLKITCNSCGQKLTAGEKLFGKTVKCPKCKAAIEIPAPAASNDLSDLLDDEPAPDDDASQAARTRGPKCERCGDELPAGTRYCVVCGHNNLDLDATVAETAMQLDKRQQELEAMARPRHWLVTALFAWFR